MNYIQEINAFYDWIEGNPRLSKNAIALWHALMHINNKTKWIRTFSAAICTLQSKSGLCRSDVFKARTELESAGLIICQNGNLANCANYTIYPVSNKLLPSAEGFNDEIGDDYYEITGLRNGRMGKNNSAGNDPVGASADGNVNASEDGTAIVSTKGDSVASADSIANASENGTAVASTGCISDASADCTADASADCSADASADCSGTKPETISKLKETKLKETKKRFDGDKKSPLSSGDDAIERKKFNKMVLKIFVDYNRVCLNLPRVVTKTDMRKTYVGARLKEHGAAKVQKMLKMAAASDFLGGCNVNGWKANFDWLFLPTNFVKVLEGNYSNKPLTAPGSGTGRSGVENYVGKPSHLEIINQTYQTLLNDGTFDY